MKQTNSRRKRAQYQRLMTLGNYADLWKEGIPIAQN